MKRAGIYTRVSGDDTRSEGRSTKGQIQMAQAHAEKRGHIVTHIFQEDEKQITSGADWNLPKLTEALTAAHAGELDVLIVRELDRFARDLAKQLIIEEEFKRSGVAVEYVLGDYPDTPEGQLNKHIRAVIAEYERELIRGRTSRGRRQVVEEGNVRVGKQAPYGYRVTKKNKRTTLEVYEPEAHIVGLIYFWYVIDDLSMYAIARKLTDMKVPTYYDLNQQTWPSKSRGFAVWHPNSIRKLLDNEVYAGKWYFGKRSRNGSNPRDNWIAVDVEPIITRELWDAAQLKRSRRVGSRASTSSFLWARRLTCTCGTAMQGLAVHEYKYYRCASINKFLSGHLNCSMPTLKAVGFDEMTWDFVREKLSTPEQVREMLTETQEHQQEEAVPTQRRLEVIDTMLTDTEVQRNKLLDLYLVSNLPKDILIERQQRYDTTIIGLKKERAALQTSLQEQTLTNEMVESIMNTLVNQALTDTTQKRRVIEDFDLHITLQLKGNEIVATLSTFGEKMGFVSIPTTTCDSEHRYKLTLCLFVIPNSLRSGQRGAA